MSWTFSYSVDVTSRPRRSSSSSALIALEAAPPSCGPVATSAGPPLAWGAAGNALARRVPGWAGRAGRPQARAPAGAGWQGVGGRGQVGLREKGLPDVQLDPGLHTVRRPSKSSG